jgi:ElaB/YqjD/DUF883 family membrane-anchored ribosome-binding protein
MSDDHKTPEEIRNEIEETREQISRELDEISYRLSPEHVKSQAHLALEDAQSAALRASQTLAESMNGRIRQVSDNVVDTLAQNPLPVTLAGAALGWLLLRSSASPSAGTTSGPSGMALTGAATGSAVTVDPTDRAQTRPQAGVLDPTLNAGVRIRPTYTDYPADRNGSWIQEHPLMVGVAALAAGALAGLLLPGTRQEDRVMGPAKGRLVGEAQEATRRLKQSASTTADEVRQEVRSSVRE